ncbi:hypothetical protein [Altericroceibacterium endophyticum]|uniref:Uncharacterized protein n=1 Tax=Altericroceibacterium endophyticum TaxID=1808508 RepID=A0A6I4T7V5_9SPHN|nr:hypothetical protein [Altericroceibacterium endophyticum]MXO65875.1 hypothetical protein [Altericroceibacterium endophyticum]
MNKTFLAIAASALALTGTTAQAATTAEKGEARLEKMLEGRVAGEPQSCIFTPSQNRLKIIDETAMVYDGGKTIYVAKPRDPRSLDKNDILVIERRGSQLCSQDIIKTVDRSSGFMTGVVFLDDFVPYTKPD